MSAFERRRLENMAANKAILKDISVTAAKVAPKPKPKPKPAASSSSRKRTRSDAPSSAPVTRATRQSSRLAGRAASPAAVLDNDGVKLETEAAERSKRIRVNGDLKLEEIAVDGKKWAASAAGLGGLIRGAQPGVRTFTEEDEEETTDEKLREAREALGKLELYDKWEVKDIKITPQRIYALGFHPTEDKPLIFAGDKEGAMGVFDASQEPIKEEAEDDDEDTEEAYQDPQILAFKTHSRTLSAFAFSPADANAVFSGSYDSSIRKVDLALGVSVQVYAPADEMDDEPISALDIAASDPHVILFSTQTGRVCRVDTRMAGLADDWQLSELKIGGFSVHPVHSHLVATASLDRTMKVWDARRISGRGTERRPALVGMHASRLSVSHAAWSAGGHVATSSYDDTVKIYDFAGAGGWAAGAQRTEEEMQPEHVVRHNNQTGRWVTILKPQWQRRPADGVHKFVIGNMNRFVDVYGADGRQLAQLEGEGITAVPAVAQMHATQNWVAGGTAAGKLCLWM
ncbi:hypothetical protein TD95_002721 [Thielaviopsis punctulata]|uniref:DNA damage-binding protein CMR1 n=1 Tax=Thielaviopsis punctulata TaxID=72032 RepID=A0A0F4Z7C7_9PEZI|nr:hypothetical protein TD95_002721 [Thielaviopsis punctulata]